MWHKSHKTGGGATINDLTRMFEYEGQAIRTVVHEGTPWFVAADVCTVLEIGNVSQAMARLDSDERTLISNEGSQNSLPVNAVNEPGLYALILGSRKPEARTFKRWITHEVLPEIRRTGQYGGFDIPKTYAGALHLAGELAERVEEIEAQLEEQEPKVKLADTLMSAEGDYSLREAAQVLARDHGIDTGQNRLMKWMRESKWVDRRGHPYQSQIECGRLTVRTSTYDHPHTGEPQITTQVRVTAKGVAEIHRRLGGRALVPVR